MRKIILLLMLLGAYVTQVHAIPFDITGPTASNVDESTPLALDFSVAQTGLIQTIGVRVELDKYWDNIFVSLSHLGTEVVLMNFGTDQFEGDSVLDAVFQDGGATLDDSCPDPFCTGTFAPLESLSAFNGMELAGTWTFTLSDNTFWDGDNSDLLASSIFGDVRSIPEPISLALMGFGLMGLVAARRKRK